MVYEIHCVGAHPAMTVDGPHAFSFDSTDQWIINFKGGTAFETRKQVVDGLEAHFPGKFLVEKLAGNVVPELPDNVQSNFMPAPSPKVRKGLSKKKPKPYQKPVKASKAKVVVVEDDDDEGLEPTEE